MDGYNDKIQMKTLSSCMNKLRNDGYDADFMVKEGQLVAVDTEKKFTPGEVRISNFYRFEGESDPADTSILYAIETNDGTKGIISDAYGVYADPEVSKFIDAVEEIMQKSTPSK